MHVRLGYTSKRRTHVQVPRVHPTVISSFRGSSDHTASFGKASINDVSWIPLLKTMIVAGMFKLL